MNERTIGPTDTIADFGTEPTLHRYAWVCVITTFCLLVWGGLVHATGSSLACPDWPLCYGQVFPEMQGGVAIEHGHRLLASLVGVLSIGLLVLVRRSRRVKTMAATAVLLVVVQGALGGLTVIFRLPPLVSTAHLALGSAFFCLLIAIALRIQDGNRSQTRQSPSRGIVRLASIGTILVYVQLVVGALVRHTSAGLACNNQVVLCNGAWWPTEPGSGPAMLHMGHRALGLLVALYVTWSAVRAIRSARSAGRIDLARHAVAGPFLVIAQIALGMWTVHSFIDASFVTAHLAGAELLLAQQWTLKLLAQRPPRIRERHSERAHPGLGAPLESCG